MEHIPRSGADPGGLERTISQRLDELHERALTGEEVPEDEYAFLAEALQFGTREAVLNSLAEGRTLTSEEARLIIATASALVDDDSDTTLERFMIAGLGTPGEVRDAVQPLYTERFNPGLSILIDWLGTYLIHAEYPQLPRGPQKFMPGASVQFPTGRAKDGIWKSLAYATPELLECGERERLLERLIDELHVHGEPFRAYLRLPGVDARDADLISRFQAAFLTTLEDHRGLDDPGLDGPVDAVDLNGRIYVFRVGGRTEGVS